MEKGANAAGKTREKQISELMNELPELVYVSDVETYDLLFVNTAGKEKFGIHSLEGLKCYKALQGLDAPCPFCTNNRLEMDEIYAWEFENPVVKSHFMLKDKLVDWDGKQARMEIAFDITRQEHEKQELRLQVEAEHTMLDCVRLLYDATDLESACEEVLRRVGEHWRADRTYLFEQRDGKLYNTMEWCAPGVQAEKENLQGIEAGAMGRWISNFNSGQCMIIDNLEDIRESAPLEYEGLSVQGIHCLVAAPIRRGNELTGFLGVDNPNPAQLHNVAILFSTLTYFLMAAYRRAENEERLMQLSYYDQLTGLYNRNRYMLELQNADMPQQAGVVYLNINGLKGLNDKRGHRFGDEMLVRCARALIGCFAKTSCYRVGGDEFVALCLGLAQEEFDSAVLALKERFAEERCTAAIGACWSAEPNDLPLLISMAAEHMYKDKQNYYRMTLASDRYRHLYDDVLGLTQPGALEKRIREGRFLLYLQPKLNFSNKELAGAEALVRYRTEGGVIVAPDQFIPLLEDARLIGRLDLCMFEQVCARVAKWHAAGKRPAPTAVNFSRYSLLEKGLIRKLEAVCAKHGVEKKWLEIEITESVEGVEGFNVKRCIEEIRNAGFRVSIDDFGVRYANLYLFTSSRFDVLKVDKSLVDDVATNSNVALMLEAICGVCKKLEIDTVAEGVETSEQFELLRGLGFQQAQGYLFSRPLPVEEYEKQYF